MKTFEAGELRGFFLLVLSAAWNGESRVGGHGPSVFLDKTNPSRTGVSVYCLSVSGPSALLGAYTSLRSESSSLLMQNLRRTWIQVSMLTGIFISCN